MMVRIIENGICKMGVYWQLSVSSGEKDIILISNSFEISQVVFVFNSVKDYTKMERFATSQGFKLSKDSNIVIAAPKGEIEQRIQYIINKIEAH